MHLHIQVNVPGLLVVLFVSAMAGNIIPAIATTNAVIAGLIVLEGLKILSGQLESCRTVSSTTKCLYDWLSYSRLLLDICLWLNLKCETVLFAYDITGFAILVCVVACSVTTVPPSFSSCKPNFAGLCKMHCYLEIIHRLRILKTPVYCKIQRFIWR